MQVREDSFPAVTDPILSLASVEARAVWNPSPAMGLIRRGFFWSKSCFSFSVYGGGVLVNSRL
jgi:hypothetical protein